MVADCLQLGGELDSSSFSHGKLSTFCFLVLLLLVPIPWIETGMGWLMATVNRWRSPGHFYQIKTVCAKG